MSLGLDILSAVQAVPFKDWTTVDIQRKTRTQYNNRIQQRSLEAVQELYIAMGNEHWTIDQLVDKLRISKASCHKRLCQLVNDKKVKRVGKQPHKYFRL